MKSLEYTENKLIKTPDVVLIGGGIMSATLGIMLKRLKPELTIQIVELLSSVALESSHAWNNAGTGHAAYCELNYTPEDDKGNVDISKALKINSSFELSLQLWSHLVKTSVLPLFIGFSIFGILSLLVFLWLKRRRGLVKI